MKWVYLLFTTDEVVSIDIDTMTLKVFSSTIFVSDYRTEERALFSTPSRDAAMKVMAEIQRTLRKHNSAGHARLITDLNRLLEEVLGTDE